MYILKNEITSRYYIGSTSDIKRRLIQHQKGYTRTTKILGTTTLVYVEDFDTEVKARERERKLKSYKNKKYIEWLITTCPVAQPRLDRGQPRLDRGQR